MRRSVTLAIFRPSISRAEHIRRLILASTFVMLMSPGIVRESALQASGVPIAAADASVPLADGAPGGPANRSHATPHGWLADLLDALNGLADRQRHKRERPRGLIDLATRTPTVDLSLTAWADPARPSKAWRLTEGAAPWFAPISAPRVIFASLGGIDAPAPIDLVTPRTTAPRALVSTDPSPAQETLIAADPVLIGPLATPSEPPAATPIVSLALPPASAVPEPATVPTVAAGVLILVGRLRVPRVRSYDAGR